MKTKDKHCTDFTKPRTPTPDYNTSFTNRYVLFSTKTSFHGFKELYESKTWWQKCIWIVIILTFTAMMCFFLCLETKQYLAGPTGTRVTLLGDDIPGDKFPPIWLVVTYWSWIDMEKVRKIGLSREELIVAMGYAAAGLPYDSEIPVHVAKKSLREKMDKLNIANVLQLHPRIALDSLLGNSSPDILLNGSYVGTNFAYHYLLNTTNLIKAEFAEAWIFRFDFDYSDYWQNVADLYKFWELINATDRDVQGFKPTLFNYDTYMSARMKPGYRIDINTESSIYRSLGSCTKNHPIDEIYTYDICRLECRLKANASVNATSCFKYDRQRNAKVEMTPSYKGGMLSLCHHGVKNVKTGEIEGEEEPVSPLNPEKLKQRNEDRDNCMAKCLLRCDKWVTTWSVSNYKDEDNVEVNMTQVKIVFPDPKTLLVIEEITQYQWYDLVSDFGGLLGLWLGASMMSLVQMFHLCLCSRDDKID